MAGIGRLRTALVVAPALLCALAVMRTTDAAFSATTVNSGSSFSAGSLQPATGVAAVYRCVLTARSIAVSWSPSPSSGTTGYRVSRSVNGGGYSSVASVAAGVTSWTDSTVSGSTTYTYRVRAERSGTTWVSAESAATSAITTPLLCV